MELIDVAAMNGIRLSEEQECELYGLEARMSLGCATTTNDPVVQQVLEHYMSQVPTVISF